MPQSTWFRDLFEKTNDLIQIVSLQGTLVHVNPAWSKFMGYEPKEVQGRNILEFVRPDLRTEYFETRKHILETKGSKPISPVFINRNGNEVFLEGVIEYIESSQEVYTRAIFRNVTERVKDQTFLQVNEKRLQTIYHNAPDAIVTIDSTHRVVEWNPKAEALFGYSAAYAKGRLIHHLIIPEEYREAHLRGMRHFLKTGEGPVLNKTIEVPAITADHRTLTIALTISQVKENDEWLFIAFMTDITTEKKLEDELSKSQLELVHQRRIDKQKDDFLSIASHELKTPLTSIKAYNQLLQRTMQPDENLVYLRKQEEQVRRLERLISDLLDVSKISTGHLLYNKDNFPLNKAISDSIESALHSSKKHEIIILNNPEVVVYGDKVRIEQVLDNLLSNAIKYSPKKSKVIVDVQLKENKAVVSVTDSGEGIPEKHLAKIFERFYRIEETAKHSGGLGLGLFISSQIIKAHDGNIWAESEPGKGTTFYFSLPVVML
jgi:PAS domain S-box-containing protein